MMTKRFLTGLSLLLLSITLYAQGEIQISGAYLAKEGKVNHLWLLEDSYCTYSTYEDDKYLGTWGGITRFTKNGIEVFVEFNDLHPEEIGKVKITHAKWHPQYIEMGKMKFERVSKPKQDLDALWRITGRKEGNNMSEIAFGNRRTIKMLVDGYFQWIAINPAEKSFHGTGGGLYTFKDGKYSETILFFSRDNSRVGKSLSFDGKLNGNKWEHSGLSSKGDPIFEIWTKEKYQYDQKF